jgi:hypothetical protein
MHAWQHKCLLYTKHNRVQIHKNKPEAKQREKNMAGKKQYKEVLGKTPKAWKYKIKQ